MNKTSCKRTLTGIIALGMILSAASCSSSSANNGSSSAGKNAQKIDKKVVNSYRSVDIVSDASFGYLENVTKIGDTGKYLITGYGDNGSEMYITDSGFETLNKIDFDSKKSENAESTASVGASKSGTIFVVSTVTDYGDFKLPDWEDPSFDPESFDFEAMEKAAHATNYVYTLDSEGNLISESEITGIDKYSAEDSRAYLSNVYPIDDDKTLVTIDGMETNYVILNKDGKIEQELDLGENMWFGSSCINKDGNLAFTTWEEGETALKVLDFNTFKLSDKSISLKGSDINNARTMCCGNDTYDYFISGQTGLYGLKADGTIDEIINWIDSDINGDFVQAVIPVENDEFIIYTQDWSSAGGTGAFSRLTRRDPSELENAKVLSLGMMYVHPDISSKVTQFNKSHDDVRIKIVDYSKYDDYDEQNQKMLNSAQSQLKMDIVSGNAPDMVFVYDPAIIKNIASKGVFADLYPLLGTNGSAKKEDIMDNVLKACEYDGKLVTITPGFSVSTLAAKSKFLDGKETWTLKEFIDTFHKLPEGTKLFSEFNSKEDVLDMLSYANKDLLDTENGKCNLNSPDVIDLLNFCNEFSDDEAFDWEHASQAEMEKYYTESQTAYKDDKAFLYNFDLSDLASYHELKQARFGEDVTLIGYPTNSGNGALLSCYTCFSILNDASDKEACWSFISQFLTPEYQSNDENKMMGIIPSLKASFEDALDAATKKPFYTDADGKKVEYDRTYYVGDKEIKIDPLTEDEKNFLRDYILNCTETGIGYASDEVGNIFNEETQAFFKGERTAEETAELLQNRISIILSEQS